MATGTTTTTTLTDQYQRFYSQELLEHAKPELKLAQFGAKKELPRKRGATTIRWFRQMATSATTVGQVQTLAEGVPISTFTQYLYEYVDAGLTQFGEALKYTDILGWTALLEVLDDGITYLGENCARKCDDLIWAVIAHATTGLQKRYSGGAANFAALVALTAANGAYKSDDGLAALTRLRINNAPRAAGGVYIGIIGPQVAFNLKRDTVWIQASTYSAVKQLFQGEIGELDGIRYVETTNVWGESSTEGTRDTSAPTIFASVFTGRDAYGVVNLTGKGPNSPAITIVDRADHADPLNQTLIAGWSAFYSAVVLNPLFGVIVRSKTTFV
jgi:N4-gp56 family major capsid protein